jgi:hypothetical protein
MQLNVVLSNKSTAPIFYLKIVVRDFYNPGSCDLPDYLIQTLTITSGAYCESNNDP